MLIKKGTGETKGTIIERYWNKPWYTINKSYLKSANDF